MSALQLCDVAKVKSLACQQAAAFHLPVTQKEVHGYWTTPPCLAVLGKREYLAPKDHRIMWDYQEVWREEMVVLAIVLQKCANHARASPNVFCRAAQEFCKCLAPVIEEADLFNMETEILEGAREGLCGSHFFGKGPVTNTQSGGSYQHSFT